MTIDKDRTALENALMNDPERAAWDAGRARERAEIVAWLREMRRVHHERDLKDLAMLVEQGRHLRTE